jgi:DNA gyrase subunit A
VIIVSKNGKIIKVNSSEIPAYSRYTRGVRIQKLSSEDLVVSVSKVKESLEDKE